MGLSLKLVIGGFAALIIALTTVVALVITQSFTMSAMRDIGCDHATTIVQAANLKVSSFFSQDVVQSRNMQNLVRQNAWPLPTEAGVGWYTNYMMQMVTMHKLFNFSYFTNILFFAADGSWMVLYPPNTPTTYYATLTTAPGLTPYSTITYNIENDTVRQTTAFSLISNRLGTPLYLSNLGLGLFGQAWAEVGFGNINGKNVGLAGLYSALVNASGTRIGLFGASFAVDTISAMLKSVSLTKNSQAFILDSLNMVLATTHNSTVHTWRGAYNRSVSYPAGCYNTSSVSTGVVCRYTANTYPYTPLRALYAERPALLDTSNSLATEGSESMKLDGKKYYVSVAEVACTPSLRMKIVFFMLESDITGEVVKGRNIAIGVMCGVCVVFVIIAFVFVAIVLMPLEVVSDRMYDAAELNDNDKDESLSALSEIAALQDSYNNLRKKLNEMKAFVPQTVLQCEDEEDGSTDSGSKEKGKQPNDTRSHRSRKESSAGDTSTHGGVGARGLNVAASLVKKGVAVLFVNVRGFQSTLNPLNTNDGLSLCDKIARAVVKEAREQKGVVSQFHGDHFLITFNASLAAASPAKRAAIAGVKISEALKTHNLKVTFGVSFGTATCGNTGCTELKGYSVIGQVVAQAAAMERLAKLFNERSSGEIKGLATDNCALDMECEVFFQAVDFVAIPAPTLVLAIMGLKSSKEEEWMYKLQETESKDPFRAVNSGFRALLNGDVAAAKAALEQRVGQSADAFGAAQLQKKLSEVGTLVVNDVASVAEEQQAAPKACIPLTGYGTYFRALF